LKVSGGKPFYGNVLIGYSFFICFLVSSFFLHARGVFFPSWMEDFSVDRTQLSLAVSLTLFTGSCFAPFMGYLIDRFRLRLIICVAAAWLAIGYGLMQQVTSYYGLLVVLVLFQGIGWTGVGPLVHTKLMVNWFSRNRGMALGIAIMGISVAGVFSPLANAWLSQTIGWRNSYSLYAALLLMLAIPATVWLVRQKPEDLDLQPDGDSAPINLRTGDPTAQQTDSDWQTYRLILSSRAFWSVVLTFGLMNGVYSAMATHLPTYVISELDFSLYQGARLLTIAGGFAIAGKVVFGAMMDRLNARFTVMCGVSAYLASTMVLISAETLVSLSIAAALFGLGFGGMVPVRSVLISRLFGVDRFSRANGLLSFFLAPATFWVLFTGWIVDTSGSYHSAFQVWCFAFTGAGIVSLIVRLPDRT
jgi:MFS family permease